MTAMSNVTIVYYYPEFAEELMKIRVVLLKL